MIVGRVCVLCKKLSKPRFYSPRLSGAEPGSKPHAMLARRFEGVCEPCLLGLAPHKSEPQIMTVAGVAASSMFRYEGDVKRLVYALKSRPNPDLVGQFGSLMAFEMEGPQRDFVCELITWMPASSSGKLGRGFDQSQLLAKRLATRLGVPAAQVFKRSRGTEQKYLDLAARSAGPNLTVNASVRSLIAQRKVLVVDDVITTGASIRRANTVLTAAGASQVQAISIARVDRR